MENYTIEAVLGKGSYGKIYQAKRKSDGLICVLKLIGLEGLDEDERNDTLNESKVMRQIDHPNIVKYYDSFISSMTLVIVMEFAPNGDLAQKIRSQNNQPFAEETLWKWLIQLAVGLKHLHAHRVLHRDIKTQNVFIDANENLKIGDLGLARIMGSQSLYAYTGVGTPLYMSPEIIQEDPYNHKSDIWALGCLMYELATLKPPFRATNQIALAKKITTEQPPELPKGYTQEFHFLVFKMLEKDVAKRPDINQVLSYSAVRIRMEKSLQQQKELQLHKKYKEYTTQLATHYEALSSQLHAQLDAAHAQLDAAHAQLDTAHAQLDTAHAQKDADRAQRDADRAQIEATRSACLRLERMVDERDEQITQLRIAMQKHVTQQAKAFEALVKDKEEQIAKREKAIHDKEVQLFQRESSLQLAIQKLKEEKDTQYPLIANGQSEFIHIHKPVEDIASDMQSLPDEDYEQLVPEEEDNINDNENDNDNIDDNINDFIGNGADNNNSDIESIGVPEVDEVESEDEVKQRERRKEKKIVEDNSVFFNSPTKYPKTPGNNYTPTPSRFPTNTPTTPYTPSTLQQPSPKPKSGTTSKTTIAKLGDVKSAPVTPHARAQGLRSPAHGAMRRNPSSAPAKRSVLAASAPVPFYMDSLGLPSFTGHENLKEGEINNNNNNNLALQRGEIGNVWEGRGRHPIYSPSSDLLFVYRVTPHSPHAAHHVRGLRIRYQHEDIFHKISPLPAVLPLSRSSPSPLSSPSPSPSSSSPLTSQRYFFRLRMEKDVHFEVVEFILEFSHPNPIDELTVVRYDRKFLEMSSRSSSSISISSNSSIASTPSQSSLSSHPTPTLSHSSLSSISTPTPPPSSPSPNLIVPSRTPPLFTPKPLLPLHALTPSSHSYISNSPATPLQTVPTTPDAFYGNGKPSAQKVPPRKALTDTTNLPPYNIVTQSPISSSFAQVTTDTHATRVHAYAMNNAVTPVAASREDSCVGIATPISFSVSDENSLYLTPRNLDMQQNISFAMDNEQSRIYAPSPYKPPLPPALASISSSSAIPTSPAFAFSLSPFGPTDDEAPASIPIINNNNTNVNIDKYVTPHKNTSIITTTIPNTDNIERVVYRPRNNTTQFTREQREREQEQERELEREREREREREDDDTTLHERRNNKVSNNNKKNSPARTGRTANLSADQLEALLTKMKLYKMKERNIRLEVEDYDEVTQQDEPTHVNTSYTSASAHASHNTSLATDTHNTSALTPRSASAMDADVRAQNANARTPRSVAYSHAGDAGDADTSVNITQSPHKQLANELLRKNAETKEALRAKTSRILQELSITKQFFQNRMTSPSSSPTKQNNAN